MFTPQRKGILSFTPRTGGPVQPNTRSGKGKGVVGADNGPPPPHDLLGENGVDGGGGGREAETWRRLGEAGMLDEASLERRDREALLEKIAKLEDELYDYQYNMGLLLIEKKEWTVKYEQLQQGLAEADAILKRDQASHLNAVSEIEKREENLRKALGIKTQCIVDLENALHEMRTENAEVKFTSDQKLAEAHALMEKVDVKSLEVEAKLCSADARLAEITRKGSELERKLLEFAARESTLLREQTSLSTDKELHAEDLAQQREELRIWERNLRDGQERLVESQALLNQREKKANESDKSLMNKEREVEASREVMEKARTSLKEKEDYLHLRLTALAMKEKEVESQLKSHEKKQKDLLDLEEKLNAREKVEIQKLIDEHNSVLDSERREFEKELEKKRKSSEEELKNKLAAVEKKEKEIRQIEEKFLKKEQTLKNKMEKLKSDVKELDAKAKALETWEATLKADSVELEKKHKQLSEDNQSLLTLKAEIETEKNTLEAAKANLLIEQEKLEVTKEQRAEHDKLQSKLKQEIADYRIMKESLLKELEDLRQERDKFEKQWEELDGKKSALAVDEQRINAEKERLEKWKYDQELKLKNEDQLAKELIQRELDELRLKKEAFEGSMGHERSEVLDMLKHERADMAREVDLRKHEVEIDLKKRLEELENQYYQKELELTERISTESDHIKSVRELATSEMQKLKVEQNKFNREKQDYMTQRKNLEEDQLEIHNDIDTLRTLSKNLKDQRDEFIREREKFLTFVEQCRSCRNCGIAIELPLPDVRPSHVIVDPENALLPTLSEGFLEDRAKVNKTDESPVGTGSQTGTSAPRMSWLRTCTKKIFNFSPGKRAEDLTNLPVGKSVSFGSKLDGAAALDTINDNDLAQRIQSDDCINITETSERFNDTGKEPDQPDQSLKVGDNIAVNNQNNSENAIVEVERGGAGSSLDGQHEMATLSALPEDDSQPLPPKQEVRRRGRPKVMKRTHSVQVAVEESKSFLKETSEKDGSGKTMKSSPNNRNEGGAVHDDHKDTGVRQKRQYSQASGAPTSELEAANEAHIEEVSRGARPKRSKTSASQMQAAGDKRYNLRRPTAASTAVVTPKQRKGVKLKTQPDLAVDEQAQAAPAEGEGKRKHAPAGCPPLDIGGINEMEMPMLQRCTTESIVEIEKVPTQQPGADPLQTGNSMGLSETSDEVGIEAQGDGYETEEGEDEEDCESDSGKHNASIGKKLWKFFTT